MKFYLAGAFFLLSISVYSVQKPDSTTVKKDLIKTGWNLGPIPFVAYDSDLGFEYGGILNFYNYGDGTLYPQYRQSIYMEISRFTKGSGVYRMSFDSKYLIPGVRTTADITYTPNQAADFYGFNGSESIFHKDWIDTDSPNYHSSVFYKLENNMFRTFVDFQGNVKGLNSVKWALGVAYYSYRIANVDVCNLDVEESRFGADTTLYTKYVDWGIISDREKNGGSHIAVKAGASYDTRDNEPNPMRGIWADVLGQYFTPELSKGDNGYMKITASFRQYFTLIPDDLSFAYRVLAQNVVAGSCPFYMIPVISTTSLRRSNFEGLGGSQTLRGVYRNRLVGDGIAFANAELRYKFWRFRFLKQNIYCAINTFFDAGMVTKKMDVNLKNVPVDELNTYFEKVDQKPHYSAGVGGKVVLNQNFVISGEIGKAFRKQDGDIGIYIGANFLF